FPGLSLERAPVMSHQSKRRSPLTAPRRRNVYRPQIEALEDRLPPGDAALSGLLMGYWLPPTLGYPDSDPLTTENLRTATLAAHDHPTAADLWPSQEVDHTGHTLAVSLAPLPAANQKKEKGVAASLEPVFAENDTQALQNWAAGLTAVRQAPARANVV